MGLVRQCLAKMCKRKILALTKVYATLPLAALALQVGTTETLAAAEIMSMVSFLHPLLPPSSTQLTPTNPPPQIQDKSLHANISFRNDLAFVTFTSDPETFATSFTAEKIESATRGAARIGAHVSANERHLARSKEFLTKQITTGGSTGWGGQGGSMAEDLEVQGTGWEDEESYGY